MVALPPVSDILARLNEAGKIVRALTPRANHSICLPIYREDQMVRLKTLLARKRIEPEAAFYTLTGLRLDFASDDDALLVKMSFDNA